MPTTGDNDNNVHPANTMRLADALIRANKRFDMMIYPGQAHSYGPVSGYVNWTRSATMEGLSSTRRRYSSVLTSPERIL
jgi:hypothetical protein